MQNPGRVGHRVGLLGLAVQRRGEVLRWIAPVKHGNQKHKEREKGSLSLSPSSSRPRGHTASASAIVIPISIAMVGIVHTSASSRGGEGDDFCFDVPWEDVHERVRGSGLGLVLLLSLNKRDLLRAEIVMHVPLAMVSYGAIVRVLKVR